MARECEICGKRVQVGNQITTRGKAKYLGGVGTKITGISRRPFRPNLQSVRVTTPGGTNKRMRVCTRCLRSGAVAKVVRSAPFRLPPGEAPPPPAPVPAQPSGGKGKKKKKKK